MADRLVKVTRKLTYIGPEDWVRKVRDNSFVLLARELGPERAITSDWDEVVEVSEVEVQAARDKAFVYQEQQKRGTKEHPHD